MNPRRGRNPRTSVGTSRSHNRLTRKEERQLLNLCLLAVLIMLAITTGILTGLVFIGRHDFLSPVAAIGFFLMMLKFFVWAGHALWIYASN